MTLDQSKDAISWIVGTSLAPKKSCFFDVISKTHVKTVFEKIIDNIKEINQKYVML